MIKWAVSYAAMPIAATKSLKDFFRIRTYVTVCEAENTKMQSSKETSGQLRSRFLVYTIHKHANARQAESAYRVKDPYRFVSWQI